VASLQAVSQPAIFVSSAAALEKLKALQGEEVAKSATVRRQTLAHATTHPL
jgi:malonyl CoA-acyl carrier protein transacylase